MARQVVVTGANGWIGGAVGATLHARGWDVTGVSRTPELARGRLPDWTWIGTGPELEAAVEDAGVVVNLAGRHPFEQPWTPAYEEAMRSSRVDTTRRVVAALEHSTVADRVLVSGSGYPVYGDADEQVVDEAHPRSRELVVGAIDADWEDAAQAAVAYGVRLVILRFGLTLGGDGGALPVLRQPFDAGSGVILGSGRQWLPWIHIEDATRLIVEAVEDPRFHGPVNVVAPKPARHAELAGALADALGVPCETTVPDADVKAMLGGAAELLLASQRMVPRRAMDIGFVFTHPEITGAVKAIVAG